MKKLLIFLLLFLPAAACAEDPYAETDIERENEIGRTIAVLESRSLSGQAASDGQYEYALSAATGSGYAMESSLAQAESDNLEAQDYYQEGEAIIERADLAAQEAMDTALRETAGLEPTNDSAADVSGDIGPGQPLPEIEDIDLPPPDNGTHNEISKTVRNFFGERAYGAFGIAGGAINGFTMYRIEFDAPLAQGGHMESQLKWPLRHIMLGIHGSLNYRTKSSDEEDPRSLCGLNVKWLTNVTKDSGNILDSDWIENDVGYIEDQMGAPQPWAWNHPGTDIYSEANTEVNSANIVDVNATYNFWLTNNIALAPRIGYRYQKFAFSSYDLNQVGYGPYGPGPYDQSYRDTQHLKWLEYDIKYRIPYVGLGSEIKWKNFTLLSHFDYSCWVNVRNTDKHLYPLNNPTNIHMISEGHDKGHAYMFGFDAGWRFWPDWQLTAGASYVKIYAGGSFTQRWYENGFLTGVSLPVSARIANKYWLTDASIQYVF